MRVLIIGASGRLGKCLVNQAIGQGHHAIAFVRNPAIDEKQHTRLTVVQGDILNADSVESAVDQCDVVLAAIARKLRFRQKTQVFSKGVDNLLRALNQSRKRLLWVTSAGVDPEDLAATGFFFSKVFKPLFLDGVYADCAVSESKLKASATEWIVFHPTRLTDGPKTGKYRIDPWHTPANGTEISRADLAVCRSLSSPQLPSPWQGSHANDCSKMPRVVCRRWMPRRKRTTTRFRFKSVGPSGPVPNTL